ncbi:hypothetical protein DYBT9275_05825 [Dyadobacter sp. CECT 9275]|uniref:START domain-containing protein n=1 Tax=Dyadobacter helix TaxID=2822344 RepID=A0A916NEN0_9BACT|nr:START domain-containing protein [Dyadobacter sp. CECT 9275]CAG5017686.1 hypothetical protein DYBT9275_05825 [Dyadobacter sp. CECT 9275]
MSILAGEINYNKLMVCLLVWIASSMPPLCAQPSWQLRTVEDGIKIYTQTVADSKVKALKVECEVKATASQVVALLLDIPASERWVCHTRSCILLERVSPLELYYYTEVSLPWPLSNRDFVTHMRIFQDPATKVVTVEAPSVAGKVAKKNGIVRVEHSIGKWIITPLKGGDRVKLEYSLLVDPGGIIPACVVNMFATEGPLRTFRNMRRQLQLPKYRNADVGIS